MFRGEEVYGVSDDDLFAKYSNILKDSKYEYSFVSKFRQNGSYLFFVKWWKIKSKTMKTRLRAALRVMAFQRESRTGQMKEAELRWT